MNRRTVLAGTASVLSVGVTGCASLVDEETPADDGTPAADDGEPADDETPDAGSIDYAREKAEELTARSKRHLEVLPDNDARALLEDLADYLITRGY